MAYDPTVWKTGDIVTADRLNKIENGIADNSSAGGALLVEVTLDLDTAKYIMDKTFQEIYEAFSSGITVIVHMNEGEGYDKYETVSYVTQEIDDDLFEGYVYLDYLIADNNVRFEVTNKSHYPTAQSIG